VTLISSDPLCQLFHLIGFEMIDRCRNTDGTQVRYQLGSLFDGFRTVVF
jgi:hypothetical protein